MKKPISLLATAAVMASVALFATAQEATQPADNATAPVVGVAEWDKIYSVFSHPRCANCHVADDRPRWSGAHYGVTRVHAFNVQRGTDESEFGNPGLRCTTCHLSGNSNVLHGPPGAEGWHMAQWKWSGLAKHLRKFAHRSKIPPAMATAA